MRISIGIGLILSVSFPLYPALALRPQQDTIVGLEEALTKQGGSDHPEPSRRAGLEEQRAEQEPFDEAVATFGGTQQRSSLKGFSWKGLQGHIPGIEQIFVVDGRGPNVDWFAIAPDGSLYAKHSRTERLLRLNPRSLAIEAQGPLVDRGRQAPGLTGGQILYGNSSILVRQLGTTRLLVVDPQTLRVLREGELIAEAAEYGLADLADWIPSGDEWNLNGQQVAIPATNFSDSYTTRAATPDGEEIYVYFLQSRQLHRLRRVPSTEYLSLLETTTDRSVTELLASRLLERFLDVARVWGDLEERDVALEVFWRRFGVGFLEAYGWLNQLASGWYGRGTIRRYRAAKRIVDHLKPLGIEALPRPAMDADLATATLPRTVEVPRPEVETLPRPAAKDESAGLEERLSPAGLAHLWALHFFFKAVMNVGVITYTLNDETWGFLPSRATTVIQRAGTGQDPSADIAEILLEIHRIRPVNPRFGIGDESQLASDLTADAVTQAQQGRFSEAQEVAVAIKDPYPRAATYAAISQAAAEQADPNALETFVQVLLDPTQPKDFRQAAAAAALLPSAKTLRDRFGGPTCYRLGRALVELLGQRSGFHAAINPSSLLLVAMLPTFSRAGQPDLAPRVEAAVALLERTETTEPSWRERRRLRALLERVARDEKVQLQKMNTLPRPAGPPDSSTQTLPQPTGTPAPDPTTLPRPAAEGESAGLEEVLEGVMGDLSAPLPSQLRSQFERELAAEADRLLAA